MVDACTITRVTAQTVDPETGIITPTATTTVYAGRCRFRQKVPVSKPANVGEAFIWLQRLELQLPMAVTGVASDDLVTATASVFDADLVGRRWRIRELSHQTHQTARRHQIEEVTS
jgi:hypothetical protein